jgi:hypothetical protein
MKICPQCGVELDETMSACPLCNYHDGDALLHEQDDLAIMEKKSSLFLSEYAKLTRSQKRKLFWELSGIILLSGILVTLIIDFVTFHSITWSRYTVTICLVLFANTTLFSFLRHRWLLMLGGSLVSTSVLLVLLDMFNNKIGWGILLGIPLLLSLYLIIIGITLMIHATRQKGFNIPGYFFLAAGLMSIFVEGITTRYFNHRMSFGWSLIVFTCMLSIAAIFFFIHFRLKRGVDFRRFFHI